MARLNAGDFNSYAEAAEQYEQIKGSIPESWKMSIDSTLKTYENEGKEKDAAILAGNIITKEETNLMLSQLDELLNPVEVLKGMITDVKDRTVCLSGNFAYGQKSAVEKYIVERGGIVEDAVKKSTNYLIIGALECEAYSNGKYGTKVKKAIEYNQKGCNIVILKETDFSNLLSDYWFDLRSTCSRHDTVLRTCSCLFVLSTMGLQTFLSRSEIW